jgi:hypothetical protein
MYARYIIDITHTYGTISDTLEVLHTEKESQLLNILERFQQRKTANERYICRRNNSIFDLIISTR